MSSSEVASPVAPQVAIVLPPGEGFSPDAVGAIGLLVARLVRAGAPGIVLGQQPRGEPFAGIPFRPIRPGWGLSRRARYASGVLAALRTLQPRLVEVHNRPDLALAVARRFRATLLLNNDPQPMRRARSPAERARLLRRLALVMTSSAWLRDRLLDGVDPARPPVVLPNCIDLPPPPGEKEKLILFAGRVVRDKGADSFVAACAQALPALPGWRAEMIGADRFAPDSPETGFVRALRPAAAAARVAMLGYQPNHAVLAAMARAAIVVMPSRWQEPFGIVALEAMASGAALVTARRGGLPEVAGDAALYADPDEPTDLAAAILRLARDPAARAALGAAARCRAERFAAPLAAARLQVLRAGLLAP